MEVDLQIYPITNENLQNTVCFTDALNVKCSKCVLIVKGNMLNKGQRNRKGQSRKENEQSRETDNIGYTRHRAKLKTPEVNLDAHKGQTVLISYKTPVYYKPFISIKTDDHETESQ